MTAAYPFAAQPTAVAGQLPPVEPAWDIRPHRLWLGQPGQMVELPSADPGSYTAAQSRGEVEQPLASGASGTTRLPHTLTRWSISWQRLAGWERSVLDGFYRGAFGPGPWCFVPPEDRNRLTLAQSLCGALDGELPGSWGLVGISGTLLYDPTVAPVLAPCGVMRWSGGQNGTLITAGLVDHTGTIPTPDPVYGAPYLPAMPVTVVLWAWTATGTAQVRLAAAGRAADGTPVASATQTATLTTTPQRIYATAAAGALGAAPYVQLELTCLTDSAPDILISNPALDYQATADVDWWAGNGVPRVTFAPDGRTGRSFDVHMNEPSTITLADAVAGRQ